MLQIQTTNLSKDQQQLLHPDFLANERSYLQMRDSLLSQYRGQWVAVEGTRVIVAGSNLLEVMEIAFGYGGHPYIAMVGAEDAVVFRARHCRLSRSERRQWRAGQCMLRINHQRVLFDSPLGEVVVET